MYVYKYKCCYEGFINLPRIKTPPSKLNYIVNERFTIDNGKRTFEFVQGGL